MCTHVIILCAHMRLLYALVSKIKDIPIASRKIRVQSFVQSVVHSYFVDFSSSMVWIHDSEKSDAMEVWVEKHEKSSCVIIHFFKLIYLIIRICGVGMARGLLYFVFLFSFVLINMCVL